MTMPADKVAEALRASIKETERLRQRHQRLLDSTTEPIAIVGMACRYAGASSPAELWQLVSEERDAIAGFPDDRGWDLERLYHPDADTPLTSYVRHGGFLADAGSFDPAFFGISPRESATLDPQQRLLLEASWEALEDAGVDPLSLRGERTGVFAGVMYQDYGAPAEIAAGISGSVVTGRVAYTLGLEGPAMNVDTACSSSLVAMHLAAQALRGGECSLALAGGVTVLGTPWVLTYFSRQRGLSPDGRCKAFAEAADGVGFAEGVGVLALERLSDAEAKGHRVLAVIRGSAVNQDGASNGLTAPNGPSQERVIRQALANARLQPQDIDAVEAHGTGTMLGDPIEAGALLATYGQERETPLRLGSVKSNIGHSQAAAGVAGVIKTVMAMREGVLPKTLHVDAPSSKVDWEAGEIELLTEATEWKPNGRPRRAGVSSFGASGTNAHLILEEAPAAKQTEKEESEPGPAPLPGVFPFVLSAKSEPALRAAAARLANRLAANPELEPADLAYSLATTRSSFEQRGVVVAGEREELLSGLSSLARGSDAPNLVTAAARPGLGRPVFLFSGYGSQWQGMALELIDSTPFFAAQMQACEEALSPHLDWSLDEVLRQADDAWLDRVAIVQPALFAVMVSLARLWQACGVQPGVVLGHSMGEIVAAHIAGGLSLDDAARLVALRSQALATLAGKGAMLTVSLSVGEVESMLTSHGERVSLAAQNGPTSQVLSGYPDAIEAIAAECEEKGIHARRLATDSAGHSAQIDALEEELLEAFAPISPRSGEGEIGFHSTLTGELKDTAELTPEYWYRNLRETVRLEPAVRSLLEQGQRTIIEIGPHPVLGFAVQETIDDVLSEQDEATVLGTLRRKEGGPKRFALALAAAHAAGAKPDWSAFFAGTGAKAVPLPTYPFQRKRYWLNPSSGSGDPSAIGQVDADHPLLSATIEDPATEGLTLTGRISLQTHPWLADHAAAGTVLLPGTAFVEMALRAGREAGCELLQELALQAPLILPEQGAVALQVKLGAEGEGGEREVSIYSRPESSEAEQPQWTLHALGTLSSQAPQAKEPLTQWPPEGAEPIELDSVYERLAEAGFDYGPAFQGLERAWRAGGEVYAEVSLAEEQRAEAQRFGVHPALLDSSLHAALDLLMEERGRQGRPILPFAWKQIAIDSPGQSSLRARLRTEGESFVIDTFDQDGAPACSVGAVIGREVDPKALGSASSSPFYLLQWQKTSPEQIPAEQTPTQLLSPQDLDFEPSGDPVKDTHAATQSALTYIQAWLADGEREAERLILLTEGAIATAKDQEPDLPSAALWGLIRSAASEHPGRFAAIDSDATKESKAALKDALALSEAEPQIALREGTLLVPRLKAAAQEQEPTEPIDPGKSVLITGGLSGIGALVARHLVQAHGARHLLLASRRGNESEGAKELIEELESLGAQVEVGACDVSDPKQLRKLIGKVDPEHPLGAVIHSAGLLDDGVIEALTPERLDRVLAPKVDGAWHLHELTKELGISQFLLFSSAAGLLGGAAQANYSAANAFLDALAQKRQSEGLPATALAWGLWGQGSGALTQEIAEGDRERVLQQIRTRLGFAPMSPEQGLALFDAARAQAEPITAPAPIDRAALRAQAKQGTLPALLRGLVKATASRQRAQGSLAQRLAQTPEAEHEALVLELVRGTAASVLGHDSAAQVEPERAFKELGFDSLAAVELRNRLGAATGVRLAATIVFDYPNAKELAGHLLEQASGEVSTRQVVVRAQSSEEPIAIVGMSCRYPGGASSPRELWQLVSEERDAVGPFPDDRGWDLERLYDPNPDSIATSYARHGGFLPDAADFDPDFFGISPREALGTDPQQRLLLEAAWEALEDAGIDPSLLHGSPTGVFAGVMYQDYGAIEQGLAPGMSGSVVTGRVAYSLGLEGPTMTVDTACSSSLVALHLASQALRSGECGLALAGGVTVLSTPWMATTFSRQRGLAPDGRCKAFAEAADGVGLSEGVGVLALERLSDAEAKGHRVLAVIRGSAVNQDGASNGLTAPNGPSQERVIRQALANARLQPQDIDAVEAHGTGTMLGDPIEAGALLATYGQERETPLRLGSVKSNIGHSQAAAGVAGVIKTVMAMREGVLPKTLHVDAPSSKVDWEAGEIELLTEATEWKPNGRPRRAGVSSFGASGTNAHLILEEAPLSGRDPGPGASAKDAPAAEASLAGPLPFILSAKTPQALKDSASRLATHIQEHPELEPTDLAHSLLTTRAQLSERALIVGSDRDELLEGLAALAQGKPAPNTKTQTAKAGRLAYLLTGQGSQRPGMGKELHETYPAYAKALEEACEQIDQHTDHPLKELIFSQPGSKQAALLERTTYAQPALFATGLALYRLLESFGLTPDLLTGHSVGEITAAHISGVFSLADAAKLIAARGALMGALPEGGAMLAIEATEPEALEAIEGKDKALSLAAVNGPEAVVISGEEKAIEAQEAHFKAQDRKTKRLAVSHAFHSPLIEPMLEDFKAVLASLTLAEPKLPVISNASGELLSKEQAQDPAYWVSHAREPVRFAKGIQTLAEQGTTTYLELGADPLLGPMAATVLQEGSTLIPTLRQGRDEPEALILALAQAHAAGAKPDWSAFFAGTGAKAVPLPTYPFQRKRYWLNPSSGSGDPSAIGQVDADHPLLSATIEDPATEGLTLTGRISIQTHPWLADHAAAGTVLLPGTAFVEMALRAGREAGCELLQELALQAPLILPEQGAVALQVKLGAEGEGGEREVSIYSRPESSEAEQPQWTLHALGTLSSQAPQAKEPLTQWPPEGAEPIELDSVYERLAEAGFDYGPAFQGLERAWRAGGEVYAEVSLAEEQRAEAQRFGVHPALLDSSLHGALGIVIGEGEGKARVPFAWNGVSVNVPGGASSLRVKATIGDDLIGLEAFDESGARVLTVDSVAGRELDPEQLRGAGQETDGLFAVEWGEIPDRADRADESPTTLVDLEQLAPEHGAEVEATARAATEAALERLQAWLDTDAEAAGRLVFLTANAIAATEEEAPNLSGAAVLGLLRSAQAEHPGRFAAIDSDGTDASLKVLPTAIALGAEEPQLALREGRILAPRLTRLNALSANGDRNPSGPIDSERTVLVTGGTGGLGGRIARHLAAEHGAEHLLLVSRRGGEADGAADLRAQLEEFGASVRIEACDVSDRAQLEALLDSISAEHPLGAVVHTAAVLDDTVVQAMDPARVERVFAPKLDAAWYLHELTAGLDLSAFVLFSSVAGVLGSPAQSNYAAANAFLDALAVARRAQGLPATSMAWGMWAAEGGMGTRLGGDGVARMERAGHAPFSEEQGLALFDAALGAGPAQVLTARFGFSALRARASQGTLSPIMRGLVRAPARHRHERGSLGERLAALPEPERLGFALDLVRTHTAAVLGHATAAQVDPERPFKELGFDSLAAVELRNRLGAATGLQLPATVVFDYPTVAALAGYLLGEAGGGKPTSQPVVRAQASEEPIAIVGMSCRLPGDASSPDELWQLVSEGRDAIAGFPADRGWDLERLYDPDADSVGTSYARQGGFLTDAADFDPAFFGISPRDSVALDPQQRLLLEATWEALENAGMDPDLLRGSQTGVFAGVMYHDYGWGQGPSAEGYGLTVGSGSILSGRIAYTLGLEGPTMSIDTACSSSLVAMHLASQALRAGECSLALAGGVTVFSTPRGFIEFSRQRGLAPDGRSKAFAETADGVGLSEGVGVLALERLSDAEAKGHRVLAVIRGSAVNQDGASNGITAPNGPSQERVIRQALANARLEPQDVDAVEAHGTGTMLGDPIEAGALLATYGRERETPLRLGSIKSNIGHSQAAAGVAGVIKTVMAMREGVLPKTLHVDQPSSQVDWEAGEIELLTEATEWKPNGHPRRAGVSSFGASGTNAHLILEEAPAAKQTEKEESEPGPAPLPGVFPFVLSAKSEPALRAAAARLANRLAANPELEPADLAYSLATTRSSFEQRGVVVAGEREELLSGLSSLARGSDAPNLVTAAARPGLGRPAFLFSGQGSQWQGMALELIDSTPFFAAQMRACEEALSPHLDWSLDEVLRQADVERLGRLEIVQPALFAVMVSLARLWQACGVQPGVVFGHSQGEIVAAHIAGGLSLDDAARLVALRSQALMKIAGKGAMLSVSLPLDEVESLLTSYGERISLAAQNGPTSQVLSGYPDAIEAIAAECEEKGIHAKGIAVECAGHFAQIDALEEELLEAFAPISPRSGEGEIGFHSTLTGELKDTAELTPEYWYRNLRETVRLEPAVRSLLEQGQRTIIEIGPHPVLGFAVQETIDDVLSEQDEATVLGTLRRKEGGPKRFALALAAAHAAGAKPDWSAFFAGTGAKAVPLPTYPFQRKRYWLNPSSGSGDPSAIGQVDADHPLLSATIEDPATEGLTLTGRISLQTHPWLADHAAAGTVLLPGTAFVEMALRAGREAGCELLQELALQAPLILPEQGAVALQVKLGAEGEGGEREVSIYSRPESSEAEQPQWTLHALGTLSSQAPQAKEPLTQWPPEGAEPIELDSVYERLAEAGFDYGPAFQGLERAWRAGGEVYAEVSLAEEQRAEAQRFGVHPALLDSSLHAALDLLMEERGRQGRPILPFAWKQIAIDSPGQSSLRARLRTEGESFVIDTFDQDGAPACSVGAVIGREVDPKALGSASSSPFYLLQWQKTSPEQIPAEQTPTQLLSPQDLDFEPSGDPVKDTHAATQSALTYIQAWLADGEREAERLILLTEGAIATAKDQEPDLPSAALWGLIRSAASEHPGRFAAIDSDATKESKAALKDALALSEAEPQIALREGTLLVPRLKAAAQEQEPTEPIDPGKSVLITGGLSGIGALVARHLVQAHGARHLLLASRRGNESEGAKELIEELESLGAQVEVGACDVSDPKQLRKLIGKVDPEHPLGAVIHSAGLLDDGVIEALTPERLDRVLAPKVDGAWHLHELTKELGISQFLLFSSAAGLLGGAAQANYSAANAFLDALAQKRQSEGLPATALAWGLWGQMSQGMAREIDEAGAKRMIEQIRTRLGFAPMSPEQGLALFDAARAQAEPITAPAPIDRAALRAQAKQGTLPALLRGLVKATASRQRAQGSLAQRLAQTPEAEHEALVLELVRGTAASVLGHDSAAQVEPERAFKELGFDSLAAVELRNRLGAATGVRLAATIVFDYPNAKELAGHLLEQASGEVSTRQVVVRAQSSEEPIAIVGMSCRYPGGASSPRELWQLVSEERDAVGPFPDDRGWDLERLYDPNPDSIATSYARHGGFLPDAADFDPDFFGISPREALGTDPQQRLLLEAAWEALEDAGIDPSLLHGSPTGVFAGVMYQDYGAIEQGLAPGMSSSGVPGRVAYSLGLEGPTMTVDTACSSSLVAMHLASQALRAGECPLALAGGVTVLSTPWMVTSFSRQRGLAPDGRCKAFAEAADGVGLSEGVGVLALERLSDAEAKGHRVLAVIRGSAVNQDGASNGLTAPNGPSQERVIRQALANARLQPQDIDAVEAHGTGTMLGDPIEAGALLATYGQERETPLRLGSVKSNIGHSQAAAGVAGVIKTVMAMREGVLPKTLHVDAPSSKVDWEAGEIELLTEATEWKPNGRPRRAGVSSFGASGTNAHLILEEAPLSGRDPGPGASAKDAPAAGEEASLAGPLPFILSAKTPQALKDSASRLATHIQEHPELEPTDLAHSLLTTRAQLSERALIVGSDRDELLEGLAALAQGKPAPNTKTQTAKAGRLAYLLTGQGSQRPGMGKELHETYPAYAKALEEACEQIDQHTDHPLKELIFSQPGSKQAALLERTTYAQPALFATGLALYRLLESFGLTPDLLTGHSVGEITAAHISGVFSLADAAKLIAARGALMGALPEGGAMLAIEATEPEALEAIEGKDKALSLAAVNGPEAVVISGEEKAIEAQEAHFKAQDRKTKRLAVSHAFHSPLIEPMLEDFKAVLASLTLAEPKLPVISNASGELLSKEQAQDPAYWVSHAREPVRFAKGIQTLAEQGTTTYLELGADPLLGPMAATVLQEGSTPIPTLRQGRDEPEALVFALAQAHAAGAKPDWSAFFAGTGAKAVPLPTYPFQRKRYWLNPASGSGDPSAIGQVDADHPLLSATIEDPATEGLTLTGRISIQTHPWLADHAAAGTVLLPGTAFVEMALRAGREAGCELLQELALQAPLILPEQGAVALQVKLGAEGEGGEREVSIYSRPESSEAEQPQWTLHALGTLSSQAPQAKEPLTQWPPEGAEPIELDSVYERLAEAGFDYGPAFQGLERAWRAGGEVYAEVSLAEEQRAEAQRFGVHPALLDSSLHGALLPALEPQERSKGRGPVLPFVWSDIRIDSAGPLSLRTRLQAEGDTFVLDAFDATGAPVLSIGSVVSREIDLEQLRQASSRPLYMLAWEEGASPVTQEQPDGSTQLLELADLDFERSGDLAADAHAATQSVLAFVQEWLADEEREAERLVLLSEGAIATEGVDGPDPAGAAVWGLIGSAAAEHPGCFALIDGDGTDSSRQALSRAIALGADEPQLVLRAGKILVPRVLAAKQDQDREPSEPIDPDKTVLITGGLSGIGALVARHLAAEHGARHLLLVNRRGIETEGAKELVAELESLGVQIEVGACDVSDRRQLKKLIAAINPEHPLDAVIHSAGLLDDGVIASLTPERLDRVLAPKVDGAWHLHELTEDLDISQFLLFSSIGGVLGGAAQANYGAANAFLDAFARSRRAQGLPAVSMGWGRWQSGMAANLSAADLARLESAGLAALSDEQALSLFDSALVAGRAHVLPVGVNFSALRAQAHAGMLPVALSKLVRVPERHRQAQDSLAKRLAGLPEAEHDDYVLELVRTHTAAVLGHSSPLDVAPERAFQELGFDSLAAVELRNRLGAVTGLRLPATLVFDYPAPAAVAAYLLQEVSPDAVGGGAATESREREIREALGSIPLARLRSAGLIDPLLRLAHQDDSQQVTESESELEGDAIDSMDVEELIRKSVDDQEFGAVAADPAGEENDE